MKNRRVKSMCVKSFVFLSRFLSLWDVQESRTYSLEVVVSKCQDGGEER